MYVVGLTGGIGSGKSTVAARFAELGAAVVDADAIAREIVEPGEPALAALVDRFGSAILHPDGSLDRAALAGLVFHDDESLGDLNAIMHPRIGQRLLERLEQLQQDPPPSGVVIMDVPLLTGSTAMAQGHQALVVVEVPVEERVRRVLASRDTTERDVRARIAAQQTDDERRELATHVIDNSGDLASLYAQVDDLFERFREAAAHADEDPRS